MMEIQIQSGLFEMQKFYVEIEDMTIFMRNDERQIVIPIQEIEGINISHHADKRSHLILKTLTAVFEGGFIRNEKSHEFFEELKHREVDINDL